MKKLLYIVLLSFSVSVAAEEKDWGRVSASLESLNHVYVDDAANNFMPVSGHDQNLNYLKGGRYATNNYLKVDYYKERISAGMQLEGYFPTTIGYPIAQNKLSLSNIYVGWTDDSYSVTAGTFYEQLGSGLLFRSWEDRALGLNNAVMGLRGSYSSDFFSVKAFAGLPRLDKLQVMTDNGFFGFGLADDVVIAAADASVSISDCLSWNDISLSLEGSVLYKHEELMAMPMSKGCKEDNIGWSGRLNAGFDGFYLKGEYVGAGVQYINPFTDAQRGDAQLLELGYNKRGLGVSLTGRRLFRINQQIYTGAYDYDGSANIMSYTPAMCTQYTYMLTTLVPYSIPETTNALKSGEFGAQLDAFYNFRRGTKIGGKRGMKVHANFSTYYSLDAEGHVKNGEFLFRDFSIDVERQWSKQFKTTFLYSYQDYNHHENGIYVGESHTVVADLLYKWTSKFSTRLELQYLISDEYQKDWMAALLEISLAPHWSIYASDMYNHGSTGMHYYNAGLSYAYRWIRVAAGYGRYRAGYICSGGVCRQIPAYTGANITLTASF
ncbi:MAG: hypothetical protein E7116_03025 [Bacteroidales bacterium]|nr:hypothetical protein [Bacteroidales bacterium]